MPPIPRPIRRTLVLAALVVPGACGGDRPNDVDGVAVTDSAGITVVATSAAVLDTLPVLAVEPITTVDGAADDALLTAVAGVHRFDDGRVAVLDRGNYRILFSGPDGTAIRTVGREGEGPGEFVAPVRLVPTSGDSLLIVDPDAGRMTVLAPDGEPGRTTPLEGGMGAGAPIGLLADGTLAVEAPQGTFADRSESATPVMQRGFVRMYRPDGTRGDSVGPFPDHLTYRAGGGYASPIFSSRTRFATWDDGVWVAPGLAPEILKIRRDGSLDRIVRWAATPRPVTQEDRDRLLEVTLERAPTGIDPAETRRVHEQALFASRMPAYGRIVTDVATGDVWVEPNDLSYGEEPTSWLVFSPEGLPRARVELPPGFRLWQANDGVVSGVVLDEAGVPSVVVMRVAGLAAADGPGA